MPYDTERMTDKSTSEMLLITPEGSVTNMLISLETRLNVIMRARGGLYITSKASIDDMLAIVKVDLIATISAIEILPTTSGVSVANLTNTIRSRSYG